MAYTLEQFNKMTVVELRAIADTIDHEAVKGHSTMHKEKLIPALCTALGIDSHVHHHVVGLDKSKVKGEIKKLKVERADAVAAKDYARLKTIRDRIHKLKHELRKATV